MSEADAKTLKDAYRLGWTVHVKCAFGKRDGMKSIRECIDNQQLDLRSLMWTRGAEFPIDMLASRLKCPSCGSRRVLVVFGPRGGTATMMAGE
ncbi:hypothetical protein [Rhodoligotrophos appendicifer]|uniref:hypothetical protein n=3 Tax=Rhodoligotrophos appendicifer TaxID=987056 RepID=UPI001FE95833|nr:hypothetical protein [Rhodoligotrophos appendicifer]